METEVKVLVRSSPYELEKIINDYLSHPTLKWKLLTITSTVYDSPISIEYCAWITRDYYRGQ